jgi:hypothetical protein
LPVTNYIFYFQLQIFTLLEVGKKMTGQSKEVIDYLPLEMTKGRVAHIALSCVKESRATFAAFCAKISHDASKHTGTNLAILLPYNVQHLL